jgi:hypothetical protein
VYTPSIECGAEKYSVSLAGAKAKGECGGGAC